MDAVLLELCKNKAEQLCDATYAHYNYKLGITVDPTRRWEDRGMGYKHQRFTSLCVLAWASAPTAQQLEEDLISHFRAVGGGRCLNIAPGGEGISQNSVAQVYVYIAFTGGRRSPSPFTKRWILECWGKRPRRTFFG